MYLKNCNTGKEYKITNTVAENVLVKMWYGLCEDATGKYFAKVLNYGEIEDSEMAKDLVDVMQNEANTLKRVMECSSKVPRLKEYWDDKNNQQYVIVMTQMPGKSLRQWMDEHKIEKLSAKDVFVRICLVVQLCEIMRDISRKYPGIVHRDLKPENIFVDFDKKNRKWVVYIIDFGCANLNHVRNVGTKEYQAPEQIGMKNVGVAINMKTDLFAIGQITYELLLGKVPHIGEDYTYKARDEQWLEIPQIPQYLSDINGMDTIVNVLVKMTKRNQEERPTYDRVIATLKNTRIG